jgi:hypothetical protein
MKSDNDLDIELRKLKMVVSQRMRQGNKLAQRRISTKGYARVRPQLEVTTEMEV